MASIVEVQQGTNSFLINYLLQASSEKNIVYTGSFASQKKKCENVIDRNSLQLGKRAKQHANL